MRRLVHLGSRRFELTVLPLAEAKALPILEKLVAVELLGGLAARAENRATLRAVLAEVLPGTSSPLLTDAVALERLVSLVRARAIGLVERAGLGKLMALDGEAEEEPTPVSARPPPTAPKLTWIEVKLIGEDDGPIPNERYRVEGPDGSVHEGRLDSKGLARLDGLDPGSCKVTFPDLDQEAWVRV